MNFIKYKVKQKIFSFNPRYIISDADDRLVATVSLKPFSFSQRATLYNESGEVVYQLSRKPFSFRSTYFITKDGRQFFRIFKTFGFKPKIFVEALEKPDAFMIQGNIWHSEYSFYKNDKEFAYVSRDLWKLADTYGVAIKEDEDHYLILSMAIVIALINHRRKQRS